VGTACGYQTAPARRLLARVRVRESHRRLKPEQHDEYAALTAVLDARRSVAGLIGVEWGERLRADGRPWNTDGDPDAIGKGQPPPMMFCPDCDTTLDDVRVSDLCPTCGGRRRSAIATAGVANVAVVAHPATVADVVAEAIDAALDAEGLAFLLAPLGVGGVAFTVVQGLAGAGAGAIAGVVAVVLTTGGLLWGPSNRALRRWSDRLRQTDRRR
jgi:hypothetical protein